MIKRVSSLEKDKSDLPVLREDYGWWQSRSTSSWVGEGTSVLGLSGRVEKRAFNHVLEGLTQNGAVRLVKNALNPARTGAWQLTLEAPQSVSTLWATASAGYGKIIQDSHEFAVSAVFHELQDKLSRAKEKSAGLEPVRLVGVRFTQTGGSKGSKLKTDLVVMNLGLRLHGPNEEFSDNLVTSQEAALNRLYERRLRAGLESNLGLEFELERRPRLQGVPENGEVGSARKVLAIQEKLSLFRRWCGPVAERDLNWTRKEANQLVRFALNRKQLRDKVAALQKQLREQPAPEPVQKKDSSSQTKSSKQTQSH